MPPTEVASTNISFVPLIIIHLGVGVDPHSFLEMVLCTLLDIILALLTLIVFLNLVVFRGYWFLSRPDRRDSAKC
jgi:hypothetical protein